MKQVNKNRDLVTECTVRKDDYCPISEKCFFRERCTAPEKYRWCSVMRHPVNQRILNNGNSNLA